MNLIHIDVIISLFLVIPICILIPEEEYYEKVLSAVITV
ncbi:MAG: hypothetical protein UR96_C0044G0001 [candidate division WS6 bacterium GW2011_GWC1_36_11]|uniref:Uncharacterized protein n=1 Tax=candidate division WS6 bacterium GW2011_GWC1_36_11 TaxID=1619090 RepID=A0A0G0D853_9BACT|nr:MAG: hypothetical protein UR96_C0044G0001 [candidate division WS6 bacterium GW2011_GWC1_36_11]